MPNSYNCIKNVTSTITFVGACLHNHRPISKVSLDLTDLLPVYGARSLSSSDVAVADNSVVVHTTLSWWQ